MRQKKDMLVTIGICAYNTEKYMYQCLKSAVEQSYKNLEIIAIDDGSTDDTGWIIDRMASEDNRIRVIHKQNEGHAAGRQQIVEMMKGDAVYWLDSDDWLKPDAVSDCIAAMEGAGSDIVKTTIFDRDIRLCGHYTREEFLKILLPDTMKSQVIGCLIRKEMYEGVRHLAGFTNEDYYIMPRLVDNAKKITVWNSRTYMYRKMRPGSITADGKCSFKGFYPRAIHRADRYERYAGEFPEEGREILRQMTDYCCMACLFADKEDSRALEVRNVLVRHEREIFLADNVSRYKKWLVREILNNGPMLDTMRILHQLKGRMRLVMESVKQ